jgi:hypothetical protein
MTRIFEPSLGTLDSLWHNLNHFSVTTKIFKPSLGAPDRSWHNLNSFHFFDICEPSLGAPDRSWHNPNLFQYCGMNIWVLCRCFWQVIVNFLYFTCSVLKLSAHLLGLVLICGKIQKRQQFLCYTFELLVLNTSRFIQKSAHVLVYSTVKALDHVGVLHHVNIRLWTGYLMCYSGNNHHYSPSDSTFCSH